MRDSAFLAKYLLLTIAQILLMNYFNFSQFVMLTFLPTMIICLPSRRNTVFSMILAFVTGFIVDFISGGLIGLTSMALVAVAFSRTVIVRLVFGTELLARGDNVSIRRLGPGKIIVATFIATSLFLLIYIWGDGAGTTPLWFNAVKLGCSLMASMVVSFFVAMIVDPEN